MLFFFKNTTYFDNFECKSQYLKLKKAYVTMQIIYFLHICMTLLLFHMNEGNKFL